MTKRFDRSTFALRVIWKNSSGCELDSRQAKDDTDVKRQLVDMIVNGVVTSGDSFHIEASE